MRYVVEVINSCCFEHDTPQILKRSESRDEALSYAGQLMRLTKRDMEKMDLNDMYITHIRVLDVTAYPGIEIFNANRDKFLGDVDDDEVTTWTKEVICV